MLIPLTLSVPFLLAAPPASPGTSDAGEGALELPAGVQAALGGDQDWVIGTGEVVIFDTVLSIVNGKPVAGGVVGVHDLVVEAGGVLVIQGPNPFVLTASGEVRIDGQVVADGTSSPGVNTLNTTNVPQPGAPGQAGGGRGGTGHPLVTASSPAGGPGTGAFGSAVGGGLGGETGWSTQGILNERRGAGGGGGRFGPDVLDQTVIGLDAEPGFDNLEAANGALSGPGPAQGGPAGASPFVDGDARNDFYGTQLVASTGELLLGELRAPWAGAGGGAGGDAVRVPVGETFPGTGMGDEQGAGGGGGGGSVHVLALGPIRFGPAGEIRARGGLGGGGENTIFLNRVGGGSGGGSGGHVVLESAVAVDLSQATGVAVDVTGGQGGAGKDDTGGAFGGSQGPKQTKPTNDACPPGFTGCLGHVHGAGGDGGPGLIQLHVPRSDVHGGRILLPPGATLADVCRPEPVGAAEGSQLLPSFEVGGGASAFGVGARRLMSSDLRFRPGLSFLRGLARPR